jgi:hypothetical protein
MSNGLLKEFRFLSLHLRHRIDEFLRKLSNKNGEVKENDSSCCVCVRDALTFGKKYDNYWGLREEENRMEKG